MPYRYSRARNQFVTDVASVKATLKEAFSPQCASKNVREYALCSAIILTSTKLETYLETLVSDWCRAIIASGLLTDSLPLNTRAFLLNDPAVEGAYRKLAYQRDEAEFLPLLGGLIGTTTFVFAGSGKPVPAFHARRIYSDSKYPSPKNIQRLFRRCGIDPFFPRLAAVAKKNVENLLTSFNDVRTEMAHDGMPVGVTAKDIKARIADAESAVGYIDRVFYIHVRKTTGPTSWTA